MSASSDSEPHWFKWFVDRTAFVLCGAVILWILLGFFLPVAYLHFSGLPKEIPFAGQFGDMFGAVNSLFSTLAFAAAMTAVLLQRIEIGESGKRRLLEDTLQSKQLEMQLQQVELMNATAEIHNAAYQTASENLERMRQERIEGALSRVISDMHQVQDAAAEYISSQLSFISERRNPNYIDAYKISKSRLTAMTTQLVSNTASLTFACIDHGNELIAEVKTWGDIVEEWEVDTFPDLTEQEQFERNLLSLTEIDARSEELAKEVVAVWTKYLNCKWRNTRIPTILTKG